MCYVLSAHAAIRCNERGITGDEIAQALAGREIPLASDRVCHYCPKTRVTLFVALTPDGGIVKTAYRVHRNSIKRLSAGRLSDV